MSWSSFCVALINFEDLHYITNLSTLALTECCLLSCARPYMSDLLYSSLPNAITSTVSSVGLSVAAAPRNHSPITVAGRARLADGIRNGRDSWRGVKLGLFGFCLMLRSLFGHFGDCRR